MLPPVLSIRNGRRSVVITGTPEQLGRFELYCSKITEKEEAERKNKLRGGAVFRPAFHGIQVEVGFHTPRLADAVDLVDEWAARSAASTRLAHAAAPRPSSSSPSTGSPRSSGCTTPARSGSSTSVPSDTVTRVTAPVIRGLGHRHRPRRHPGGPAQPVHRRRRARGRPGLVELRADAGDAARRLGEAVDQVHPADRTSPILLAGMTPTTVDAKIVAAAANAGHWAELAGGGQVTEEIFDDRIAELTELLEPGRAVQFNSLFLDPYLWKLQVGGKRLVQKARQSGAPIDGVVVTAGIPDLEEAVELIEELNSVGISHVVFKPGTVDQIKSVIKIAAEVPDKDVIVHIEGGRAGGHHSWEDLDDLLLATYADLRKLPQHHVCVGGGIGTPERAAEYLSGRWAEGLRLPGRCRSTASWSAPRRWRPWRPPPRPRSSSCWSTPPAPTTWVGAGKAQGGMASGRSQLGADIHEIDNAASRCGRLLDEVAGDADAVAERRDEIIAAMADTAKPYFGDVADMTYLQWLQRYVELAIGDGDSTADTAAPGSPWLADTWRDRFAEMLKRAEARLHPQDFGPIETLFDDAEGEALLDNPDAGDRRAAGALPRRRDRHAASGRRAVLHHAVQDARASRSTSCRSSTRTCAAGGAATRCGRPTTRATPPTRCASSRARSRWRASPASTSRSATCSTGSSRPRSTSVLAAGAEPVAGGVAPPGPRRRHRPARRRARLARRVVGRPHRHQPGAPHRCARRVAGQREPQLPHTRPPVRGSSWRLMPSR